LKQEIALMTLPIIDLRSDTLSLPTEEMLRSMTAARLGDDSRDGDPTVLELEALSAELTGKEAGLFTPSGTMSNLLAMRTHCEPGASIILEGNAHIYNAEFSGLSAGCGLLALAVPGRLGAPDLDALKVAAKKASTAFPARGLLCLENTHNGAGGTVVAIEHMERCAEIARGAGLRVHLDGARLFNAAVALGRPASDVARCVDSVCFCLSKGLSAPIGSVLCGDKDFIVRARQVRRMFGGAMRQAGAIAAPGIIGLRSGMAQLAADHANARRLGEALAALAGLSINLESVQTNMVRADVKALGLDGATFAKHLAARGVRGLPDMGTGIRFVTYRNITAEDIERAIPIIADTVAARPWA
jgi:threonine aldolase